MLDGLKKMWRDWRGAPQWEFWTFGKEGIDAMYEACESAKKSIDCEQFIFGDDDAGLRFIELFMRKQREGVKIRLLCDAAGSWQLHASQWPEIMRDAGIEVRFFNPIRLWRTDGITTWFFRTHRKILIIDDEAAISGGLGIRDDMMTWRDTTFLIRGETVHELAQTFERSWVKTKESIFFRFKSFRTFVKGFRVTTNAPRYRQRHIYWSLIEAIRNAEKSILLTTPYFVPDRRFMRAVRVAAHRGIEVKLLLPEVLENRAVDRLVNWATHSHFKKLLTAGVRIFRYQNGFLHAKTVVIDGNWATIGSFNLDHLSFLWNYETNVESTEPGFVRELEKHFNDDLKLSKEVILSEWENRYFFEKIFEYLTLPLHGIL